MIPQSLRGYLLVAGAASMWGTIGIFFTVLHDFYHLSAFAIGFFRASLAAFILVLTLVILEPARLKASGRSLALCAGFGLFGIGFFYIFNTEAVIRTNVATAAVLLYTAPAFVTVFARWRWHEAITIHKLIALVLTMIGCALVARAYNPALLTLNLSGILIASAAGLAYACFTIFSKALSKQSPWTTVAYSLIFGTLALLPLELAEVVQLGNRALEPLFGNPNMWVFMLGLCLGPTLGSYALYNLGLKTVPASNASVVAAVEPVVASFAGYVFFGQTLELLQIVGAVLIVGSALALSLSG